MSIPFICFDGYIKRICFEDSSQQTNRLFDILFSKFSKKKSVTKQLKQIGKPVRPLSHSIILIEDLDQPRRFVDFFLPKGCYYTVCMDGRGNDCNTLVHELRAYRDPINAGMIEVVDLSIKNIIKFDYVDVILERSPDIGVLIHNIDKLQGYIDEIPYNMIGKYNGHDVYMIKLPYKVFKVSFKNVIDLRQPITREWFFDYFSQPQEKSCIVWPEQISDSLFLKELESYNDPTIAISKFKLVSGRTLRPRSFWEMLPTLMNPDIGGGFRYSTGSTIFAIAWWMKNNSVSAFIFPSARCDVSVKVEGGQIKDFFGWNLIDYRVSGFNNMNSIIKVFDHSPWCWLSFPNEVLIDMDKLDSRYYGSFRIEGMVNYWAKDYLEKICYLEEISSDVDTLCLDQLNKEVWMMGIYVLRWIRSLIIQLDIDGAMRYIRKFKGLALRNNLFDIGGGIDEIFEDLNMKEIVNSALLDITSLCKKIVNFYEDNDYPVLAAIFYVANTIESTILFIEMKKKMKRVFMHGIRNSGMKDSFFNDLKQIPFPDKLKEKINELIQYGINILFLETGDIDVALNKHMEIEEDILKYFKERI